MATNTDPTIVHDERGHVLVGVLVLGLVVAGLGYSSMTTSLTEVRDSQRAREQVRAFWAAHAGAELAVAYLDDAAEKTSVYDPLHGVRNLFADGAGGIREIRPYDDFPLVHGGQQFGTVTVSMNMQQVGDAIEVRIVSTGYARYADGVDGRVLAQAIEWTAELREDTSAVFDHAYFINNWGWFYGDPIYCSGNVRSNGQFDAGGYKPQINGQPLYDRLTWNLAGEADLIGYRDDNRDGLYDGNDGGIFASWGITGSQNVRGNGGNASNQHEFEDPVPMPNLTDLSRHEVKAIATGGRIEIGGSVVAAGVVGDDPGEPQNLYLVGTAAQPIEIHGTVVVRGDVVLHGVVTGTGAIYCGRNAYVPNDLRYGDAPATPRPADNTETATEAWITANKDRSLLGLFAREHVVLGDFTHSKWRNSVGPWLSHSLNRSDEDAGDDGIPNTAAGRDGILGTADDDVLEDDGNFSTRIFSALDAALGLIPPGFSIGDPIPGTGEDIDGDGLRDGTTTLADFNLSAPITSTDWAGNVPTGGIGAYSTIGSTQIARVDGVLYTNHAAALYSDKSTGFTLNGSLVSRNEAMVFTGRLDLNYDARLLGGNTGMGADFLPRTFGGTRVIARRMLDHDPNRSMTP